VSFNSDILDDSNLILFSNPFESLPEGYNAIPPPG